MASQGEERPDASLSAYTESHEPRVEHRSSVELGSRTVGYIGRDVARDPPRTVYVSQREADEHRYHGNDYRYDLPFTGEGYGLSLELFSRLVSADANIVYIVETDTGDIYQFAFSQFVDGTPINMDNAGRPAHPDRGYEKDPQKVVPLDAAVEVYEDVAGTYRAPVTGY